MGRPSRMTPPECQPIIRNLRKTSDTNFGIAGRADDPRLATTAAFISVAYRDHQNNVYNNGGIAAPRTS